MDPFNLARFKAAQAGAFDQARRELLAGRKRTHWMWFIFPQLRGLGRSPTAQFYGVGSRGEAQAYLADPDLGPHLLELCEILAANPTASALEIFGSPDDMKLRSCATLFASLPDAPPVFAGILQRYFEGAPDPQTLALLD